MQIKLIDSNYKAAHPSSTAWRNSRPDNTPIPLDEILQLDLPVNEMPMATLFIESTILEREIIVSLRNHVMWAQTSRVQDILNFTYPDCFGVNEYEYFEGQRQKMQEDSEKGIRQDGFRRHLPLMSLTKHTVNLSMRDIITLTKYFLKLAENAPHVQELFNDTADCFLGVLFDVFGFSPSFIEKYRAKPVLRNINNRINHASCEGDIIIVSTVMSLSLRAQLARHRNLTIQDNLEALILQDDIAYQSIEMPVVVQVSGLAEDWLEVIKKRSCWIAQYDLWSDLLNKASAFFEDPQTLLPCANGACPYDGDAKARYTEEDPNAPCPIHAQISNTPVRIDQITEMNSQWHEDKRPSFWMSKISNLAKGDKND